MNKQSWGFYGGTLNKTKEGFGITLHDGNGQIHLDYQEAASLTSLLWKILFTSKIRKKKSE